MTDLLREVELLRQGAARLRLWHAKYGEHSPQWLPPGGDVRWLEDVDAALARSASAIRAALASAPPAAATVSHSHSWRDFGQLGGRNVVWCSGCDSLAFTGQEPAAATVEVPDERIKALANQHGSSTFFNGYWTFDVESLRALIRAALSTPTEGGELPVAEVSDRCSNRIGWIDTKAAGVPPGYVLVPREPTGEMLKAVDKAIWPTTPDLWLKGYRAMLAASGAPAANPTISPAECNERIRAYLHTELRVIGVSAGRVGEIVGEVQRIAEAARSGAPAGAPTEGEQQP